MFSKAFGALSDRALFFRVHLIIGKLAAGQVCEAVGFRPLI